MKPIHTTGTESTSTTLTVPCYFRCDQCDTVYKWTSGNFYKCGKGCSRMGRFLHMGDITQAELDTLAENDRAEELLVAINDLGTEDNNPKKKVAPRTIQW